MTVTDPSSPHTVTMQCVTSKIFLFWSGVSESPGRLPFGVYGPYWVMNTLLLGHGHCSRITRQALARRSTGRLSETNKFGHD